MQTISSLGSGIVLTYLVSRTSPFFLANHNDVISYLLPRPQTPVISVEDSICMSTPMNQRVINYTAEPMLCVKRGSKIILRYQENGHVSLLNNTPGKNSSGTIFVYGTTESRADDMLLGIHGKWNLNGTGGDRRGRLLVAAPFDDGQCYQVPSVPNRIYSARRTLYPPDLYHGENRWCRTYLRVPSDPHVRIWTLYWVWDWTNHIKVPLYTTCIDVCIID